MDNGGKLNGKLPVFEELLAFVWNKLNVSPHDTLINLLKLVFNARDVFFF